jgi:cytochrome c oxidase subunit 3
MSSTMIAPVSHGDGTTNGSRGVSGGGDGGNHGAALPQRVYITGMLIALGAILMFFMALISAWVVRRGFPNTDWQPVMRPRILWLNTLVLLASSATLVFSRHCHTSGRDSDHRYWWNITTILGVTFLAGQFVAWRQLLEAGLLLATNPASSFLYVFTAAHGLHVLGGIAALVVVAHRTPRHLTREIATRAVALYWHFLGALWLLIFALLLSEGSK